MKRQLIALLLIAVMTVSVLGVVGVTTMQKSDALKKMCPWRDPCMNLNGRISGSSPTNSYYVLSGQVIYHNKPLRYEPVTLYMRTNGGPYRVLGRVNTDANGRYIARASINPKRHFTIVARCDRLSIAAVPYVR